MKKTVWIIFLGLIFLAFVHAPVLGFFLDPVLEKTLSDLFGTEVKLQRLRVDLFRGKVEASKIRFMNPPGFSPSPHLDNEGILVELDFGALRRHHVKIRKVHFRKPFYYIERVPTAAGPRNNVKAWWNHIKERVKSKRGQTRPGLPWKVEIAKIEIEDGIFIMDDMSRPGTQKKFVFRKLEGFLEDFRWRSDPDVLNQTVHLRGTFGERYPAPFVIKGRSNFATGAVGFDLKGEIPEGDVREHETLLEGMPFQLAEGKFQLRSRSRCLRRELESYNLIILESLKVTPRSSADAVIWGLPLAASINFLQEQKKIYLKVPVHGNITDPKFEFTGAFRKAFQEALGRRTNAGMKALKEGSARLATQTTGIVRETPGKIAQGIGKISNAVTQTVASNIPPVLGNHQEKKNG